MSKKFIHIPGAMSICFFGLSFTFPTLIVVAIGFSVVALYSAYARYCFSPVGGDVQVQIEELVLAHFDWNGKGKALDIECGNGPLTIKFA